jgi:hypothetical protein
MTEKIITRIKSEIRKVLRSELMGESNTTISRLIARSLCQKVLDKDEFRGFFKCSMVVCDDDNNPPSTINRNELVLDVALQDYSNTWVVFGVWVSGCYVSMMDDQDLNDSSFETALPIGVGPAPSISNGGTGTSTTSSAYNWGSVPPYGTVPGPQGGNASYAQPTSQLTISPTYKKENEQSTDLPKFAFTTMDEHGKKLTLTLNPDYSIDALTVLKITSVLFAKQNWNIDFWVYGYVKKNNLERHFDFKYVE